MTFEISDTEESRAFVTRNPHFPAALDRLLTLANKCFGRAPSPKNQFEDICFWLGHTCRQDFIEIIFLGVHGYGGGATKLLRSLYERAVTVDYLIKNPSKVEKFVRFAAIQEHRALEAALRAGITESQIDEQVGSPNTVAEIRDRFNKHKAEFKATECQACGLNPPASWDLDFSSMVRHVGEPFNRLFLLANNNPNFLIHATLASAQPHDDAREKADAQLAIMIATDLLLAVITPQNGLFGLGLDADVERCGQDLIEAQAEDLKHRS